MISIEPLFHKGSLCIALKGNYDRGGYKLITNLNGIRYSRTHGCFYLLYSEADLNLVKASLSEYGFKENGFDELLPSFFQKQDIVSDVIIPNEYDELLVKMRYSESTRENYNSQFKLFLSHIYPKNAENFTEQEVHEYMLHLVKKRKTSLSTQNMAINAIKFCLEHVKRGERRVYYIDRPRKEMKLPIVLSEEEVQRLFYNTKNIKHRCSLFILYSSGLRISELLNLKREDIDPDRKVIYVRGGKGRKDRVTLLSPLAYEFLIHYLDAYKPVTWLFESPTGSQYSARSVNNFINVIAKKAGILKRVSAHTLRHSFATHLLEHGTDLRYIQTLLGHENSKTTERYAQVTRRGFDQLISPLDRIAQKLILESNKGI